MDGSVADFRRHVAASVALLVTMLAGAASAAGSGKRGRRSKSEAAGFVVRCNFSESMGTSLLMLGLLFCVFGLVFGMTIFVGLKNLPVHRYDAGNVRADL